MPELSGYPFGLAWVISHVVYYPWSSYNCAAICTYVHSPLSTPLSASATASTMVSVDQCLCFQLRLQRSAGYVSP